MAAEPSTAVIALRSEPSRPEPLAVAPFPTWLYEDASKALTALIPEDYEERKAYASDLHWQDGRGWVGPAYTRGAANYAEGTAAIKRQFAPYDGCGEVLAAVEDAFSQEAQIGFDAIGMQGDTEITSEVQRIGDEAIDLLTQLWDRVRLHEALKPAIRAAAWADRSAIRWWIPPGRALRITRDGRDEATIPKAPDFQTAAEWLALSRPTPDVAGIVLDEATQERAAVYLDSVKDGEKEIRRAVIAYRDGDVTVWRTLYENEVKDPQEMRLSTGGYLPIAEMTGDNLLTPSVIATQKQLDYAESVVTRTVETAGFPERYIGNAEPSGVWTRLGAGEVPLSQTLTHDGIIYHRKPEPRTLGASVTTELVGIVTPTDDGKQARATPSVDRFEPVDPEFAIKVGKHARAKILRMCRQGHRAGDSTGEASGFAYQQDRAAFEKDLGNRKGAAEGLLRDLLTAALGLIEGLTDKPGYFTSKIRLTVDMHVDAGPRSPDERNQDRMDVEKGLLSAETAMSRGAIEDVTGEVARIESSTRARLALLKEVAEIHAQLSQSLSDETARRALLAAGVDEEIVEALRPVDTDVAVEP
jgi:hypothetical protein